VSRHPHDDDGPDDDEVLAIVARRRDAWSRMDDGIYPHRRAEAEAASVEFRAASAELTAALIARKGRGVPLGWSGYLTLNADLDGPCFLYRHYDRGRTFPRQAVQGIDEAIGRRWPGHHSGCRDAFPECFPAAAAAPP
jgi:hypothetical protein